MKRHPHPLSFPLIPARGLKQNLLNGGLSRVLTFISFNPRKGTETINASSFPYHMAKLSFPLIPARGLKHRGATFFLYHNRLSFPLIPARGLKPFHGLPHYLLYYLSFPLIPARGLKQARQQYQQQQLSFPLIPARGLKRNTVHQVAPGKDFHFL